MSNQSTLTPRTTVFTPEEVIANVEKLVPSLRERIFETEKLRQLPEETIQDAHAAGVFSLLLPERLGGSAGGAEHASRVMRTLAKGDPTAAWTLGFLMIHNFLLARYPVDSEAELFVDGRPALMGGVANPPGRAVPVEGGYLLSGRWAYCSGVMHADWVEMAAIIEGEPAPSIFLARRDEIEVIDTWFMSGMKGTGSQDIKADEVFVPSRRVANFAEGISRINPGNRFPEAIYHYDARDLVQLIGQSIIVGIADAILEDYRIRLDKRRAAFSPVVGGDTQAGWIRYARAVSDHRAASTVLENVVRTIVDENAASDDFLSDELRAELKLDGLTAIRLARQAVETAIEGSGSGIFRDNDVTQHYLRDMYTLLGHLTIDPDIMQSRAGEILLGRIDDPASTLFFV